MLIFDMAQIGSWVGSFMWPFMRISALFLFVPLYGAKSISVRFKIALAVMITIVVMPTLPPIPPINPISVEGLLVAVQQITIGVAIGLAVRFVIEIFILGGQLIARQAGLGFAMLVDPQSGMNVPLVSQLYMMAALLIFLSMNGHLIVIEVLVNTFHSMPIGGVGFSGDDYWKLVSWGTYIFKGALSIAMPAIIAVLVVYLAFGVLVRAAPQINVFSVGFNFVILIGLLFLYIGFPMLLPHIDRHFTEIFNFLRLLTTGVN